MISIDFGNSYTKVSLRYDDNSDSASLSDPSLEFDEYNICIPTVAATLNDKWYYGVDVRKVGVASNLTTYRNWKPLFFENEIAETAGAISHQESAKQLKKYRDYLHGASADPGFDLTTVEPFEKWSRHATGAADVEEKYKEIALGFFRWLRKFVEPMLKKYGVNAIADHPTRIMLPNFGSQTAAREMLVSILQEAGWRTAEHAPAIHEPLANIIGVSTGGKNRNWEVRPGQKSMTYFRMFEGSPLFKAMREYHTGKNRSRYYWMMAVDLGGYTTDFGMLGFDLDDIELPIQGTFDGKARVATISYPHGVQMLDNRILDVVSDEKSEYLKSLLNDPDQHRLETLHRRIYQQGAEYMAGPVDRRIIFREGAEGGAIDDCIRQFAEEIAGRAEAFLDTHQYDKVDCVVLTGGGCHIPLIRDIVCDRIERYSSSSHKTIAYVPATEDVSALPACWHRIEPQFIRGATAAGGASAWFDSAADA